MEYDVLATKDEELESLRARQAVLESRESTRPVHGSAAMDEEGVVEVPGVHDGVCVGPIHRAWGGGAVVPVSTLVATTHEAPVIRAGDSIGTQVRPTHEGDKPMHTEGGPAITHTYPCPTSETRPVRGEASSGRTTSGVGEGQPLLHHVPCMMGSYLCPVPSTGAKRPKSTRSTVNLLRFPSRAGCHHGRIEWVE